MSDEERYGIWMEAEPTGGVGGKALLSAAVIAVLFAGVVVSAYVWW